VSVCERRANGGGGFGYRLSAMMPRKILAKVPSAIAAVEAK
jgi:hypothetical protein